MNVELEPTSFANYKTPKSQDVYAQPALPRPLLFPLIHASTRLFIKNEYTRIPFILLAFRPFAPHNSEVIKVDPLDVRRVIGLLFKPGEIPVIGEGMDKILADVDPVTLMGVIKWALSRLNGGILGSKRNYKKMVKLKNEGLPFFQIVTEVLKDKESRTIVQDFFELLLEIFNEQNDINLVRLTGLWFFDVVKDGKEINGFGAGVNVFSETAEAMIDSFFLYASGFIPQPHMQSEALLPTGLWQMMKLHAESPEKLKIRPRKVLKVTLQSMNLSANPFVLIRRVRDLINFGDPSLFASEEEYNLLLALEESSLSKESKRILELISEHNSILRRDNNNADEKLYTKTYADLRCKTWSSTFNNIYRSPLDHSIVRPNTNIYVLEFHHSYIVNSINPPKRSLPYPTHDPTMHPHPLHSGPWEEVLYDYAKSKHPVDPEDSVTLTYFLLDDFFVWTWMNSLSPEQPERIKAQFGRSIVVELMNPTPTPGNEKVCIVIEEVYGGKIPSYGMSELVVDDNLMKKYKKKGKNGKPENLNKEEVIARLQDEDFEYKWKPNWVMGNSNPAEIPFRPKPEPTPVPKKEPPKPQTTSKPRHKPKVKVNPLAGAEHRHFREVEARRAKKNENDEKDFDKFLDLLADRVKITNGQVGLVNEPENFTSKRTNSPDSIIPTILRPPQSVPHSRSESVISIPLPEPAHKEQHIDIYGVGIPYLNDMEYRNVPLPHEIVEDIVQPIYNGSKSAVNPPKPTRIAKENYVNVIDTTIPQQAEPIQQQKQPQHVPKSYPSQDRTSYAPTTATYTTNRSIVPTVDRPVLSVPPLPPLVISDPDISTRHYQTREATTILTGITAPSDYVDKVRSRVRRPSINTGPHVKNIIVDGDTLKPAKNEIDFGEENEYGMYMEGLGERQQRLSQISTKRNSRITSDSSNKYPDMTPLGKSSQQEETIVRDPSYLYQLSQPTSSAPGATYHRGDPNSLTAQNDPTSAMKLENERIEKTRHEKKLSISQAQHRLPPVQPSYQFTKPDSGPMIGLDMGTTAPVPKQPQVKFAKLEYAGGSNYGKENINLGYSSPIVQRGTKVDDGKEYSRLSIKGISDLLNKKKK